MLDTKKSSVKEATGAMAQPLLTFGSSLLAVADSWSARQQSGVLDVNPDYQPWLVERTRLFAAVNTLDGDKKRGLLLIE
jgi:hypothetical protein